MCDLNNPGLNLFWTRANARHRHVRFGPSSETALLLGGHFLELKRPQTAPVRSSSIMVWLGLALRAAPIPSSQPGSPWKASDVCDAVQGSRTPVWPRLKQPRVHTHTHTHTEKTSYNSGPATTTKTQREEGPLDPAPGPTGPAAAHINPITPSCARYPITRFLLN